jgi:hypothetical protein
MTSNERPAESIAYERLDKEKDPLVELNGIIDWSLSVVVKLDVAST